MALAGQHDTFQARLARIDKTGGGPAVLLSGVEEIHVQRQVATKAKRGSGSIKKLLGFPVAFVIGAVSMIAGHVIAFRYLDEVMQAGDALGITTMVAADIVIAAVISLLLLLVSGYAHKAHILTAVLGFAVIITQEIELARQFPEVCAQIYSPRFVEQSLQAGKMLLPDIATSISLI